MKTGVVALAVLAFFAFVIVGAWNGKFSPASRPPAFADFPEAIRLTKELEETRALLKKAEDGKFRLENETGVLGGAAADDNSKIQELLEQIGKLTAMINQLTAENRKLKELLKQLTKDFEAMRNKLKLCEAQDAARSLEHQYCNMKPGTNML
jgi:chromosome segregation ATPase